MLFRSMLSDGSFLALYEGETCGNDIETVYNFAEIAEIPAFTFPDISDLLDEHRRVAVFQDGADFYLHHLLAEPWDDAPALVISSPNPVSDWDMPAAIECRAWFVRQAQAQQIDLIWE